MNNIGFIKYLTGLIRRFLQHVLPKGFKKVRHFGYLSARNRQLLALLQYRFGTVEFEPTDQLQPEAKIPQCPVCGKPMVMIDIVGPGDLIGIN